MTEEKENCKFQQNYNVFGLDDKPCCYLYHKYCEEIDNCYFKRCKRLEQENKKLKEEFEKTSDGFLKIQYKLANNCDNYRKALEEIKNCINTYCAVDNDFINSETYLRIIQELEVLNESK